MLKGLALGLGFAISDEAITPLITGQGLNWSNELIALLTFPLIFALLFGLFGILFDWIIYGWSSNILSEQKRRKPNEGIWRSAGNGLIFTLILTPVNILFNLAFGGITRALIHALALGLINYLAGGGGAYIKHMILRLLLWRAGYLPRNYARFLDYAAERILLRKVGSGYIFAHRQLLDYFASLPEIPK